MKKIIYSLMALAAAALMSSCQKEVNSFGTTDETVPVSFSLNLENDSQTRAETIGDASHCDQLIYSLFREANGKWELQTGFGQGGQVSKMFDFPNNETINLARGQNYKIVFWAQKANTGIYELAPSTILTINYDDVNNNELRDAFCKVYEITAAQLEGDEPLNLDVVLRRLFAQVNVGVYDSDWNDAVASGITVEKSKVQLKDIAYEYDLLNSMVRKVTDVTYDFAAIPAEKLEVDLNNDGTVEKYKWLSMCYVLPSPGVSDVPSSLTELAFVFETNGNTITLDKNLTNIPIQNNWRTNIIGQILTGTVDLWIAIDSQFDDEYNHIYEYNGKLTRLYDFDEEDYN